MKYAQASILQTLWRPDKTSHKGVNGKVLVIGGSRLFHASIFWSADVASKLTDMVYFSSPANENNELVRKKLKQWFWNGIVVDFEDIEDYIHEAESILIGPGMERIEETELIVNTLLKAYPAKRWVVDGGALQMVDHRHLTGSMIITPHHKEWEGLVSRSYLKDRAEELENNEMLRLFSAKHNGLTILLKGVEDVVCGGDELVGIKGGNEGMTKGGTGDVLAGLVAALYAKNDAMLSAQAGSMLNKMAGDRLYERVGTFYNSSDLVGEVGSIWGEMVR